ncbi:pyridoxal phosphate-dependent aminotransferase [uncultured Alistipes sp.]|uniref:pyridoxal phosphate-dependent aminotransferase n=1 Tax=uncultured Alistipes sp. TaxID=538949 RepID=UPI002729E5BE|nr:pyridoxal phosphate-dependent aminotransferase [uncultured Alistipes sp.]
MTKTLPLPASALGEVLERMEIADIAQATIRQSGDIARTLEQESGTEFLHLEMGIPGLPPHEAGVEAECAALRQGVASLYPNMFGIPALKNAASRFVRAFLDVDIAPKGCIPTVGSMQGSFCAFLLSSQLDPQKDTILFIDPGFPVQRSQVSLLNIRSESFDIYEHRAEKLGPKIESYLSTGRIAAIVYSNPNNPAWICLTEDELRTLGELATRYDTVVIEDLAYLCMDFRKPLGRPFEPPYQATVARYTDNYILLISGSKIFSYAGQRIAIAAISDALYRREYPALRQRYGIGRLGEAYVLAILYAASSGTSHSAQYALAAMFDAAADGRLNFVGDTSEYARRARRTKEIFLRHGFRIVYDKDRDEEVSDGFFYTVGYPGLSGSELLRDLLLHGICAIALSLTGSCQEGIRVCVSQMNRPEQFDMLEERLALFAQTHPLE